MASVILQSIGASVGNMLLPGVGGALFGGLAGGLGGLVDAKLGLGTTVTGPKLENLSVQDSRYGAGIPIVYGNARVAGNVIWSTELIETQHTETVGGKGGALSPVVTTHAYTYSVHCAIGICAGPIAGIHTIWADSTIIYQEGVWTAGLFDGVQIYTGDENQTPDSLMQSILGADSVPAYRRLAYVVFDNLQLSKFGNRLPNLTFEIAATTATHDPLWLGSVDATIAVLEHGLCSGTALPIVLEKSGQAVRKILVGGFCVSAGLGAFVAAAYNVAGSHPAELSRKASATFALPSSPTDFSWALSPDGRFVALYLKKSGAPTHIFALYDIKTETFGALCGASLSASSQPKKVAWIDAQHFVIDDISENVRGLRVFARAGMNVIDLGFTALWGIGSGSTTTLFYGAQFLPYADGLLAFSLTSANVLQARTIGWRGDGVAAEDIYSLAPLSLGNESGKTARFIQTGNEEWTLAYGNVLNYALMSFVPASASATITRSWQVFSPNTGTNTTFFPVSFGDRLLVLQKPAFGTEYLLSEILLSDGCFTLTVSGAPVANAAGLSASFGALKLDHARFLFLGITGLQYNIGQLAVVTRNAEGSVAAILSDILTRAGYSEGDVDVTALSDTLIQGYVLQDVMSARSAIEPLQYFKPFDLVETEGQLKAVVRGGGAVASLAACEARAAFEEKEQPPSMLVLRAQEMDLPREVDVDVIDPLRNFEVNTQRARRSATTARAVLKMALPVVCDPGTAKRIAETRLYTAWAERDLIKLSVSRTWLCLEPADVVDLGNGELLRIASVRQSGGLVDIEGFYSHAEGLNSAAFADGGEGLVAAGELPASVALYLLDLPLLQTPDDQPGVYVAASAPVNWKGASIYRSGDGVNYAPFANIALAATAGIATTVLGDGPSGYLDKAHTVDVQVGSGSLSSCSLADLLNGANAALLGDEILQFQKAELKGPGLYTLSHLLRGRRGTEEAVTTHGLGERFVLLKTGALSFVPNALSDRSKGYAFRLLSPGQTLGSAQDYAFTYNMKTLCPLAPVNIKGTRSLGTSGDLTIRWTRRARLHAEWCDYIDVPLDETQERYDMDIMDGSAVKRAFKGLASPSVLYTAEEQTADWGSAIPSRFTVKICQISARYGAGNAATAQI